MCGTPPGTDTFHAGGGDLTRLRHFTPVADGTRPVAPRAPRRRAGRCLAPRAGFADMHVSKVGMRRNGRDR
ncbi:hypothetical protein GCM10018783_04780 [Streptomyces griseosporeus]|nr:hypothetical protein GCM10018783_04780 [Streptomyces griseosporeus]